MELIVIATLCIGFSILVTPCASHQTQVHSSLEQVHDMGLSLTALPRKLRPIEEPIVERHKLEGYKPEEKQKEGFSGMQHGREGTRQSWIEGKDTWQFFTMDYSPIRRRPPIHNKAVPDGP